MNKHSLEKLVPSFVKAQVLKVVKSRKRRILYKAIKEREQLQKTALEKLKNKETIRCVFCTLFPSNWKYDRLYELMEVNPRFEPIILVCPIVNEGREVMLKNLEESYQTLKTKGYNVILSYDKNSDTYIDLQKDIKPDVIFYLNPYKGLIDDRYYITNIPGLLACYIPYYINNTLEFELAYNTQIHNFVWRSYLESEYHLEFAKKYSTIKAKNCLVTGYPGIEKFVDSKYIPVDLWKIKDRKIKRIIWAPHQSVEPLGTINYSCFLMYYEFMFKMAEKYAERIQIAFKPHPLLKKRLYEKWGKERTDDYYKQWDELPNCTLVEGEYADLFLTSDAMIHDSASFITEYLYVDKPVMRTSNGIDYSAQFNKFGIACLDCYYVANKQEDVELFIQNVINGVDPMEEKRLRFVKDVLTTKGSPSQNIINDIIDSIDNQILYRN